MCEILKEHQIDKADLIEYDKCSDGISAVGKNGVTSIFAYVKSANGCSVYYPAIGFTSSNIVKCSTKGFYVNIIA